MDFCRAEARLDPTEPYRGKPSKGYNLSGYLKNDQYFKLWFKTREKAIVYAHRKNWAVIIYPPTQNLIAGRNL
jgi:hypothetical protein